MTDQRPDHPDNADSRSRPAIAPAADHRSHAPESAASQDGIDALTGLYDRLYFDEWLQRELAVAGRHGTTLSLLLLGVDHFATINDRRGSQVGDVVLKLVARSIQTLLLPQTMLARFGGAQFALVARETSPRNLEIQGNRVCHRVAALSLEPSIPSVPITVSGGVASTHPGGGVMFIADTLVAAAQAALHEAERLGGSCIRMADEPGTRT